MSDEKIGSLLTADDAKRVREAIEGVERSTAGEIMVVVAARSDHYADVRGFVALIGAIAAAWVLYWFLPTVPSGYIFGGEVVLWIALFWLTGLGPILRTIVPAARLSVAVDNKAKQVFIDHGLTETRDRSGVLILVSELEHRVEILADRGIHEVVGNEGWEREVNVILRGIGAGRAADGLREAVEHIGARLSETFPPRSDDTNELSDHVRYVD